MREYAGRIVDARLVKMLYAGHKPITIERLDVRQVMSALEGASLPNIRILSGFSYGKTKAYLLSRRYRGNGGASVEHRLQVCGRPGDVHSAIGAQRPPGPRPGAGQSIARPFRTHFARPGVSCRQWHPGRPHSTR